MLKTKHKILLTTIPLTLITIKSITYIPEEHIGYCIYSKKVFQSGYHLKCPFRYIGKIKNDIQNDIIPFPLNSSKEYEYEYELMIVYKYNNNINYDNLVDNYYTSLYKKYLISEINEIVIKRYNNLLLYEYYKFIYNIYNIINTDKDKELLNLLNERFNKEGFIIEAVRIM